jgi:hypothetical protein
MKKETKDLLGENRDYLTIQILRHSTEIGVCPPRLEQSPAFVQSDHRNGVGVDARMRLEGVVGRGNTGR